MVISIIAPDLAVSRGLTRNVQAQVHFFRRRGNNVRLYLPLRDSLSRLSGQPAPQEERAGEDIVYVADPDALLSGSDEHFSRSDLYVYHCPMRYPLLDSIKQIERGVVILCSYGSALLADLAPYADLITAPDPFTAGRMVEQEECEQERVSVLPYPVAWNSAFPPPRDMELVQRYDLEGRRVILSGGKVGGEMQLEILAQALAWVRQQIADAMLLWLGDAPDGPCPPDMLYTGAVTDTKPYYTLADLYLALAPGDELDIFALEAMATGVPVIAARGPVSEWSVGLGGLLFSPDDAAGLAECIMRVLTDDALCGTLVQNGRARAREFSCEQYENRWARLVARAADWLPAQPYPQLPPLSMEPAVKAAPSEQENELTRESVMDELKRLEAAADVMLRGYQVRSRLPLVAWVRRNLTSHLREPYLDPMFERQVAFNREVVKLLNRIVKTMK